MLAIKDDNPKLAVKYLNLLTSKKEVSEVPFDVLYQLGVAYDKMKDYENAIENFKRAISIDSRYSKAYKRLGYTYDAMGRHGEAVECFKKAMELEEI